MKKLTPEEITTVVTKIREKYDDYTWRFFKPKSVRNGFEDRYVFALRTGIDISSFLLAEASAVEELIRREEAKVNGPVRRERTGAASKPTETQSATDRILERQRERIAGYPDAAFHSDANEEVRRMLGALTSLATDRWDALMKILRNTAYSPRASAMVNIEHEIRHMGWVGSDGVPSALSHYVALLKGFPRDYAGLEREQKNYLLAASFLLHDIEGILKQVLEAYPQLGEAPRQTVRETLDFVTNLIDNFRLRDFKRRK